MLVASKREQLQRNKRWPICTWPDLLQPSLKGRIAFPDNPREFVGIALKTLGHPSIGKDICTKLVVTAGGSGQPVCELLSSSSCVPMCVMGTHASTEMTKESHFCTVLDRLRLQSVSSWPAIRQPTLHTEGTPVQLSHSAHHHSQQPLATALKCRINVMHSVLHRCVTKPTPRETHQAALSADNTIRC